MKKPICTVSTCDRRVLAKGLCTAHYQRLRRGSPLDSQIQPHGDDLVRIDMRLPPNVISLLTRHGPTRAAAARDILVAWARRQG